MRIKQKAGDFPRVRCATADGTFEADGEMLVKLALWNSNSPQECIDVMIGIVGRLVQLHSIKGTTALALCGLEHSFEVAP